MNKWRIYIRDLGDPDSTDKRTKVHGTKAEVESRAKYLNQQMARRHGDGKYHAYIAPDNGTTDNMEPNTPTTSNTTFDPYYLYDDIGRPKGVASTYEEARQKCDENEGWTMVAMR